MENEGSSNFDGSNSIGNIHAEIEDEKQLRRDREEDDEIDGNIEKVARDGDLTPRHISNLKSGVKRSQPSLPLQVKTRSNKDMPGGFSQ
uniref:Putative ovule protein n=1 Tax=Solanum chacoense TaxID=4108 RepID=A0A0V0GMM4_SOLCH